MNALALRGELVRQLFAQPLALGRDLVLQPIAFDRLPFFESVELRLSASLKVDEQRVETVRHPAALLDDPAVQASSGLTRRSF